ncbi:hypothetical protein BDV32DRAFT_149375 [Aspergillus pseudonomiae]|nr:hypothetical protein BDV32DRAFT_149375 [Aspergillus pseudonomiae]
MGDWFPRGEAKTDGWHLDALPLLAVLGGSSVKVHLPALTTSWLCFLPRLIPAPEVMLNTSRPTHFEGTRAVVVGVHSGTRADELNFLANLLHPISDIPQYEFREYNIKLAPEKSQRHWYTLPFFKTRKRPAFMAMRKTSVLNILTILSFAWTVVLICWAVSIEDGAAIISIGLLSLAATVAGIATYNHPQLCFRPADNDVPAGDVIIRTRYGAFILVTCDEDVARELYNGTEERKYLVGRVASKILECTGTLLLMVGVVLLGNCKWTMQTLVGATYLVLNIAYWVAALLPRSWIWDVSRYRVEKKDKITQQLKCSAPVPSYTRALWCAIYSTKEISWISISGAAPITDAWKEWERQAYDNRDDPTWDAVSTKAQLMEKHKSLATHRGEETGFDAANNAPRTLPT